MLRTSIQLEKGLDKIRIPFFVLHGEADTVTCPEISQALYEQAGSKDKTMKLYPGMRHGLTAREPDDNIEIVFNGIIGWLDRHCGFDGDKSPLMRAAWATPSPSMGQSWSKKQRQQRWRAYEKYFCGFKGHGVQDAASERGVFSAFCSYGA